MIAIILAGGRGTRLRSVVHDIPKPMALVNDRPFLTYILDNLSKQNFENVILSVGFKKNYIKSYFGFKYKNLNIEYSEESSPLGTGGALKKAMLKIPTDCFIFNGDTYLELDFGDFKVKTIKNNSNFGIALSEVENEDRYGECLIDDLGLIRKFNEKKFISKGLINAGVYYLANKESLRFPLENKFSFENDILVKLVNSERVFGYAKTTNFIDIGIPADYQRAKFFL